LTFVASLASSLGAGSTRDKLGGGSVNATFCALDTDKQCHWEPYALSLAQISLPFIILAALSILAIPFFIIGRYAFGCCGGRRPAPGTLFFGHNACFGKINHDESFRQYPKYQLWAVILTVALLFVAVIVCMIVGLVGNGLVHKGIDNSFSTVTTTLDLLASKINSAVEGVNNISGANTTAISSVTNSLLEVAKNATTVSNQINDSKSTFESARSAVTIIVLILPALFILMAAAGGIFRLPKIIYAAFFITFLVSLLLWLATGIYVAIAVMAYDGCNTARPYVAELRSLPSDQVPTDAIPQFIACSNGAQFANYRARALQTQDSIRSGICSLQNQICQSSGQTCSSTPCQKGNYNATLATIINDDNGVQRTATSCAVSCTNSNLKTATSGLVRLVGYSETYDGIYYNDLLPVINCSIVDPAIDDVIVQVCGDASTGTNNVAGVFLALAILEVFITVVTLMSYKRWRNQPQEIIPAHEVKHFPQFELAEMSPPYRPESMSSMERVI